MQRLTSILVINLLAFIAITSNAQLPSNLRAYYSFNNTLNDSTGINSPATNYGATSIADRNNTNDFAFGFDGTSKYIDIGTDLSFGTTTIAFWIKPSNLTQTEVILSNLFNLYQHTSTAYEIRINACFKIDFFIGNANPGKYQIFVATNPISKTKWTHVAVEIENNCTGYKLYINGALDSQIGISGITYSKCLNPFLVGARSNPHIDNPYSGSVDEVMIFNKTLSATEILQVYSLTNGINKKINNLETSIFPNPGNDKITIESLESIESIKVVNSIGSVITNYENLKVDDHSTILDLSMLKSGLYYIFIETKLGIKTEKFLKL